MDGAEISGIPDSENLEHSWPFDDSSDTSTAVDTEGDKDLILTDTEYQNGVGDGGLHIYFEETDGIATPEEQVIMPEWGEFTLSLWTIPEDGSDRRVYAHQAEEGSSSGGILLSSGGSGLEFRFDGDTNNDGFDSTDWHMLTMSFDGSRLWCYIDDDNVIETSASMPSWSDDHFDIGNRGEDGSSYDDDNFVDHPKVWSSALDSSQVKDLYDVTKSNYE